MPKNLRYAIVLTVLVATTSRASRLAYEGFDYLPMPLLGLNGGLGFTTVGWAADPGVSVQPPGLSSLFGLPSIGLCVGGGFNASRQLDASLTQPEYWVSYMIQANPGNDMVYLGLDTIPSTPLAISFGRLLDTCFIRQGGTTIAQVAYPWAVGSTYLLVARFQQGGAATRIDLWINPANLVVPPLSPPVLTVNVATPAYNLVNFQVQAGFLLDEIRIGTAPGDVAGLMLGGSVSGGNLTLSWPVGMLLQAPTPNGPWHTNNAPSPYTVPMTGPQQFFRVIVQ